MSLKSTIIPLKYLLLFALLCLLFSLTGAYNFCYVEQWHTFIYHGSYICDTLARPGGCVQLLADFLTQFFLYPWAGIVITSLLLTCIAWLMDAPLNPPKGGTYDSRSNISLPFGEVGGAVGEVGGAVGGAVGTFIVISLFFLLYNVNFNYAGTVAFLPMLLLLRLQCHIRGFWGRFAYDVASIPVLFIVAGPITLLYTLLLIINSLSLWGWRSGWRGFYVLLLPLLVYLLAAAAMRLGYAGDLKHLLLPDGYFVLRLQPGSIIYLPWGVTLAVFVIAAILNHLLPSLRWKGWGRVLYLLSLAGAIAFLLIGTPQYIDRNNETFKELDYYGNHQQWNKIINRCNTLPLNNLLFQNYLNMALAEKGILADYLFREPCIDIRTIYVVGDKNPYISSLLSDIYFSMGHMAFSQRYAFEANEGMGNLSPRMLKRLVQTNLVYGAYGTAEKYLSLLEHTLYYKDWATAHQRLLWNDAAVEADSLLGSKRRCLFPDNRFSGIRGLDDDLKQIVLCNPAHKPTIHYLGCLYLLSKDLPRFRQTLETFYGTPALPSELPVAFQEGVVAFANGDKEILEHYHIAPSVVARFEQFKQHPQADKQCLWFFLKFRM